MNLPSILIAGVILAAFVAIVVRGVRNTFSRSGGGCGHGCAGCSGCGGVCSHSQRPTTAGKT